MEDFYNFEGNVYSVPNDYGKFCEDIYNSKARIKLSGAVNVPIDEIIQFLESKIKA